MGLSSTVNPQCTPRQTDGLTDRQTDGHAPDNSPTYALMHCMHLHRWTKNEKGEPSICSIWRSLFADLRLQSNDIHWLAGIGTACFNRPLFDCFRSDRPVFSVCCIVRRPLSKSYPGDKGISIKTFVKLWQGITVVCPLSLRDISLCLGGGRRRWRQ